MFLTSILPVGKRFFYFLSNRTHVVLDPNSNDDGVTRKYISVPENQKADNAEYVIWKSMGGSKYKEYVKLPPKSDHALFITSEK